MRTAATGFALLALVLLPVLPVTPAANATTLACGRHVRWAEHHDPTVARLAITSEDGNVTLLLTDREVAVQLSDRMLHRVNRELRDKEREQDNVLGSVIVSAVAGTVREMIEKSFECRVRDLRDVTYEDGRLQFIGRDGEPVFERVDICDSDLASAFSERDARRFVSEFRAVKAGR
jgi:hypothetical protein